MALIQSMYWFAFIIPASISFSYAAYKRKSIGLSILAFGFILGVIAFLTWFNILPLFLKSIPDVIYAETYGTAFMIVGLSVFICELINKQLGFIGFISIPYSFWYVPAYISTGFSTQFFWIFGLGTVLVLSILLFLISYFRKYFIAGILFLIGFGLWFLIFPIPVLERPNIVIGISLFLIAISGILYSKKK